MKGSTITHPDRGQGYAIPRQAFIEILYRFIPSEGNGMNSPTTNVVLADDHPRVRAGIRNLLENAPDIVVVGEAENGIEAISLVEELSPDVLIVDMEMPYLNGNEVAARLREKGSKVRILALSAHDDRQYIMGMFNNGAAGYLTKDDVPEILIKAIRGIARGEEGWVSKRVAVKILKGNKNHEKPVFSDFEQQILKAIGEKKTNADIAGDLGISEETVEKHVESLCRKLEVDSRIALIAREISESLV